jgi:hypothetical protein
MNRLDVKPRRNRDVISGVIRVLHTGCRWADCLSEYASHTTIHNRWSKAGISLFFPMLLTFSGCTHYVQYWVRAGENDEMLEATSASCAARAGQQFPPVTFGRAGFYPNPTTQCVPTAGGPNCGLINPGYLPQATAAADTNAAPRAAAFQSCMMAAGWRPLGVTADGRVYLPPNGPEARGK